MLFRAIPQRDVKPLAKKLIAEIRLVRRGHLGAARAAEGGRRARRGGVTEFKIVQAAAQRLAQGAGAEAAGAVVMVGGARLLPHRQAFAEKEQFRILFLDKRNQLIADEVQQSGTVDHTPVYPREVVKRALELSATAIILVHNHPSGDPTPSRADIEMTQAIVERRQAARHRGARPHHRRQGRPREPEGAEADLSIRHTRRLVAAAAAPSY